MRHIIFVLLLLCIPSLSFAKGIVVSTYPLFLIAQEVTKGVEQPILLLTNQQNGHDVQLTPKNRQVIQEADLIVWLGRQHETALQKALADKKNAISILDSDFVKTLPERDVRGEAIANTVDSHVWLEPNNAVRIAFFIAALRSQQQPQNKAQYWKNAQNFSTRMFDATKIALDRNQDRNYWAYHDAYQYLERVLQLKFAGALTTDPEIPPTVSQIKYLNDQRPQTQMCMLAEVQVTSSSIVNKLQPVTLITVDEAMSGQKDFVLAWLKLANAIQKCFL